ncbi:MAG TPA: KH domain-containing protein [Candidatus Saccharimonadales bacterium]|nr:KH domain-containing protein [Candidatus Saccharimonadales bacterium]
MKDALTFIISSIVDDSEKIRIEEQDINGIVELQIFVAKDDIGKVIGKEGKIIRAIRNVMKIIAMKQNKKIQISVDEFV